jgi:hypothetical protein
VWIYVDERTFILPVTGPPNWVAVLEGGMELRGQRRSLTC